MTHKVYLHLALLQMLQQNTTKAIQRILTWITPFLLVLYSYFETSEYSKTCLNNSSKSLRWKRMQLSDTFRNVVLRIECHFGKFILLV